MQVVVGSCQVASSYGIDMAESCGWNKAVINKARGIRSFLMSKTKGDGSVLLDVAGGDDEEAAARESSNELLKVLSLLEQEGSDVSSEEVRDWLCRAYEEFVGTSGGGGRAGEKRQLMLKLANREDY